MIGPSLMCKKSEMRIVYAVYIHILRCTFFPNVVFAYPTFIGADFMFLVSGQKAPRSVETSMESSGWGVPGCPPIASRLGDLGIAS